MRLLATRSALATVAIVATFTTIAGVAQAAPSGPSRDAAADPSFGPYFGSSADRLPAFLHVTRFGLRARIRTAAIGVKATCHSDGSGTTTTEPIGVNGTNILVGRDGRFSFRRTRTENQTITTYRLQGTFTTPRRATGTASVTTLTQGEGLSTVSCGSGTKRFTVTRR